MRKKQSKVKLVTFLAETKLILYSNLLFVVLRAQITMFLTLEAVVTAIKPA